MDHKLLFCLYLFGIYIYMYITLYYTYIIVRLAKIDLVTIFDCDYRWYCTIDYVIVNYIGIHHLFYHIQWFFSHQSSIVHKTLILIKWRAWLSARFVALNAGGLGFDFRSKSIFSVLICNNKKGSQLEVNSAKSLIQQWFDQNKSCSRGF